MKRADFAQLERLAGGPASAPFRPAREAQLLRGFAQRHAGVMAFPSVAQILREILMSRAPLEVFLLAEAPAGFVEIARCHFGALANLNRAGSAVSVLERVRAAPGAVGLLPMPAASGEKWWLRLLGTVEGAPRIVARVPSIEAPGWDAGALRGFAIACLVPEASGEDRTLIVAEANAEASPGSIERALTAAGLKVQLLDRASERGLSLLLFEADGFLTETEVASACGAPIESVHILGAYPVPLEWPRSKPPSGEIIPIPLRPSTP